MLTKLFLFIFEGSMIFVSKETSSLVVAHDENLEEKVGMKSGKIENSCEFLDYMYYDQVNKSWLVQIDKKIS